MVLTAKKLAAEFTIINTKEHNLDTELAITDEHIANNATLRSSFLERGIRPETLSPAEDVKKVERRLKSATKKALKNPETLE